MKREDKRYAVEKKPGKYIQIMDAKRVIGDGNHKNCTNRNQWMQTENKKSQRKSTNSIEIIS